MQTPVLRRVQENQTGTGMMQWFRRDWGLKFGASEL